jgi:hypothetical protein
VTDKHASATHSLNSKQSSLAYLIDDPILLLTCIDSSSFYPG